MQTEPAVDQPSAANSLSNYRHTNRIKQGIIRAEHYWDRRIFLEYAPVPFANPPFESQIVIIIKK